MSKFERICQTYMPRLINDLGITVLDASAVFGNAGYESGGMEKLQEIKPVVKGSRGGFGWFQWTGPRRRAFEAFCKENGRSPGADEANYLFLVDELQTTEKAALAALAREKTLDTKTVAFELAYERAGVKHYPQRKAWALKALHAYEARTAAARPDANTIKPLPPELQQPDDPGPKPKEAVPASGCRAVTLLLIASVIGSLIAIPYFFGG